jgi:hypothetical protein
MGQSPNHIGIKVILLLTLLILERLPPNVIKTAKHSHTLTGDEYGK